MIEVHPSIEKLFNQVIKDLNINSDIFLGLLLLEFVKQKYGINHPITKEITNLNN